MQFAAPIPAALVELSSISVAQQLDQANGLGITSGWLINSTGWDYRGPVLRQTLHLRVCRRQFT